MAIRGYADNAICPQCRTYTRQQIVRRGWRRCDCSHEFKLSETQRIQGGKVIYPRFK